MPVFLRRFWALLCDLGRGSLLGRVLVCVTVVVVVVFVWAFNLYWREGPLQQERVLVIAPGMSLTGIARHLDAAGVVSHWRQFVFWSSVLGLGGELQAGEYAFTRASSLSSVLDRIRSGRTVSYNLTVPEGLTNFQVAALLSEAPHFFGEIMRLPAEGRLLPSTYAYRRGDSRQDFIARLEGAMVVELSEQWSRYGESAGLGSEEEALILASLIERETGIASERRRISGVFHNRLRLGMKLQSDPTLVYWESGKRGVLGRGLRRSELRRRHPYNTYLHEGLPPAPIANPGRDSIFAALNPLIVDDLYFVADGEGGHRFARTLRGHVRNVRLWRRIEVQHRQQRVE